MAKLPRNTILVGDARGQMQELPEASIDCVLTSPPYYQLRDFGVKGQIGLEPTVTEWVEEMRLVMHGVARVLKPGGSVWLNLGDAYSRHPRFGAPTKSLMLSPERLLLALSADGWIVRNKVVWAKTNPVPTSVLDRLNTTYDVVYFLVRSKRYFFDVDAIRIPHKPHGGRGGHKLKSPEGIGALGASQSGLDEPTRTRGNPLGKNPGDVWPIASANYRGGHFGTFPPKLVERPLLATCPARICVACREPWKTRTTARRIYARDRRDYERDRRIMHHPVRYAVVHEGARLRPSCRCGGPAKAGIVLDPFFGTGTVGAVAEDLGRDWIGIELNPEYVKLAEKRLIDARIARIAAAPCRLTEATA